MRANLPTSDQRRASSATVRQYAHRPDTQTLEVCFQYTDIPTAGGVLNLCGTWRDKSIPM